jgi:uncharacterized protein YecE (DUF72 family)
VVQPSRTVCYLSTFFVIDKPQIHIGTSGWSYAHWKNLFYPAKVKQKDWLEFYANHFSCTEINTSFYHLPRLTTTEKWKGTVPADFLFCPKMSRYLTHLKKLHDAENVMRAFFDVFKPLKRRLGPVLVQLPPFLKWNEELAAEFYQVCRKKYAYYEFALEARHSSWLADESIEQMKLNNISLVISHSGAGFPFTETVTASFIYLRLHGPAALYASDYPASQLKGFAKKMQTWKKEGRSVWAFFNNDIHGYAIANAKFLQKLCNEH